MAAYHEPSVVEYDFVDPLPSEFFCPVTFGVLRKPHQTLCCGNHLSQETVSTLEQSRGPCPLCKKKVLSTVPDKFFERKVNQWKVRCQNKDLGCEWEGELGSLEKHLNKNLVEGGCQFVAVACPYSCSQHFLRCQLEEHKRSRCPVRPFTCQYCNLEDTYNAVTSRHWSVCEKYPLECPNECGETEIHRKDIARHLDGTCPLQVIKCEFSCTGCKVECQRQHMQAHLDENVEIHLAKVSQIHRSETERQQRVIDALQRQMKEQNIKIDSLEHDMKEQESKIDSLQCEKKEQEIKIDSLEREVSQQESTIDALQCGTKQQEANIERLESKIAILERKTQQQLQCTEQYKTQLDTLILELNRVAGPAFGFPFDIEMGSFEENKATGMDWYSAPFYSHIGGYRMCLRVDAGGHGKGRGTHVSLFVYFVCGQYDEHLRWPFRGEITIQLLNQSRNEGHFTSTIRFNNVVSDGYANRVMEHGRGERGWGYSQFIALAELRAEDREYLKSNCLKFRITNVVRS